MFPGTAYGKYPVCRSSGTGLWTGSGLCSGADPKSVRTWKSDGISGQYVWRPDLRTGLQENAECVRNLIGEVLGTSILGGFAAYPVAVFLMGKSAAGLAVYAYVVPFLISTAGGAIISAVLILSLKKANILAGMQEALREEKPAHV